MGCSTLDKNNGKMTTLLFVSLFLNGRFVVGRSFTIRTLSLGFSHYVSGTGRGDMVSNVYPRASGLVNDVSGCSSLFPLTLVYPKSFSFWNKVRVCTTKRVSTTRLRRPIKKLRSVEGDLGIALSGRSKTLSFTDEGFSWVT